MPDVWFTDTTNGPSRPQHILLFALPKRLTNEIDDAVFGL